MGYCVISKKLASFYTKAVSFILVVSFFIFSCFFPSTAFAWGEFTIADEIDLGKKFNVLIKSRLPIIQDPEVVGYINGVVDKLSKATPPQPFPFTTSVVRHNALNAFASPGGYVFVYTGLILAVENESELAGVLAHEMGHVTQRHVASRIEQSRVIGILSLLGALAGAFIGKDGGMALMSGSLAAGQSAMLSYSRADESEADQVGMNYLCKAGYSPWGMVGAFKVLAKKQWIMGSNIPTYLTTHPGIHERIDAMTARINGMPAQLRNRKDNNTKLRRIQTLIRARYSDPDIAMPYFEKTLQNGENKALTFMGLGILYGRLNRVTDASNMFANALSLAPTEELIVREAGRFHYLKGNKDMGAKLLEKAIAMNSRDIMAMFYYARLLADNGDLAKAISYTREILRFVPEDVEVHEYLALYYGKSQQLFKAYLHMAYAALYSNDKEKVAQNYARIEKIAKTAQEKSELQRFETHYKERKEFW